MTQTLDKPAETKEDSPADTLAEKTSDLAAGEATDELTGHNYDGIEEYDNPLPGWWTGLLVATFAFGLLYLLIALLVGEQIGGRWFYQKAVAARMAERLEMMGELEGDAETITMIAGNDKLAGIGQSIFLANCASCHGQSGEGGLVGPNLTDDYYVHAPQVADLYDIVKTGRANGQMPAWGNRLAPNDVVLVSGYVASLKGTNAPNGAGREGERVSW
jgi:cytochrome c oxidase cbb3-type subunit 3